MKFHSRTWGHCHERKRKRGEASKRDPTIEEGKCEKNIKRGVGGDTRGGEKGGWQWRQIVQEEI